MDFSILLYLSMMFYVVRCSSNGDDDTQHLINQLTHTKMKIQGIISGLQRFRTELELTSNSELTIPTGKSKDTMRIMSEATFSQIIKDVKEALKKGKNEMKVANCLKQAKTRLSTMPGNNENAIEKCQDDAIMMAVTQTNLLDAVRKRGDDLNDQLDSIVVHCADPRPFYTQRCVGERLREINKNIDIFATDALKQKGEVRTTVNNVVKNFKKCTSNVVGTARVQISKAKQELDVCLQHA